MHFLLFFANFCYLWYELQYAYIPLYFFMIFCTDVVGIWGLYLLTKGHGGEIEAAHLKWFQFCTGVIFAIMVLSIIFYDAGMKCHPGRYPFGLSLIVIFYIFWSIYVCHVLRKDKFLSKAEEEEKKECPKH
jgi:hypothetical protein